MSRIIKDANGNIKIVFDMAMSKREAINRCGDIGYQFVEHFKKILQDEDENTKLHHAKEMQVWFNQIKDITLKYNKKKLTNEQLIDWFFTYGSIVEYLFPYEKDQQLYTKLIESLFSNETVENALRKIGLLK